MFYDTYQTQKTAKAWNRDKIISEVSRAPKRFSELVKSTKLSEMGLYKILLELQTDGKIKKDIVEGKPCYVLTKKGREYQKRIWYLVNELLELKEHGAGYIGRPNITEWGLSSHFVMSIKHQNGNTQSWVPFPNEGKLKKIILEQIIDDIKHHKIGLSKPTNGKVILALEADLSKMTSFFGKVQLFMQDIIIGKDVFYDSELGFNEEANNRLALLNHYLHFAFIFEDKAFEDKLPNFFKTLFNDKKEAKKLFPVLDINILIKVMMDIENEINPLDDAEINDKLSFDEEHKDGYPFLEYIGASEFFRQMDNEFVDKVNKLIDLLNRKNLGEKYYSELESLSRGNAEIK